jgi:ADP-heptose:LPS heptosyltransferase
LELFVTGLSKDQAEAERIIQDSGFSDVQNMCGKLSLQDLIHFLETADALVAPSTGPLHLAAAMGLRTVGLYVPRRPMHPGRWAPLGQDIRVLTGVAECRRSCSPALCPCMAAIQPSEVAAALGY